MKETAFNETTKWSNLSRFGSSKLAKLTIAAPFVALFILLNDPLHAIIAPISQQDGSSFWGHLASKRLEIFYLGLLLIGSGSGMFATFGPIQITSTEDFLSFIRMRESVSTQTAAIASLQSTVDQFMSHSTPEEQSAFYRPGTAEFPARLRHDLFFFLGSQFEKIMPDIRSDDFPDDLGAYFTGTGHVAIEEVLDTLTNRRRVQWNVWKFFYQNASELPKDIYRLEYMVVDYRRPKMRYAIYILFVSGTVLCLMPTVYTAILVIGKIFS